jgi:peptide-methionine (R)-S-oxide reductase|tara:strand:+ start:1742 stop:2326 length:585 start_codon:yes stop_codon:yes gene_type:complete
MKNKFINIVFFVVVLNLFQINLVNADNSLESFDMSNVKVLETPFWCSMTDEERASAVNNLTAEQKRVALEDGTERPFDNLYWNSKQEGIYVDIVTGEPLFSSLDKFDSGTGWPSFDQPIKGAEIVELADNSFGSMRTEVRSQFGDNHLGHLFNDGPSQTTGLRYCINSASLNFISVDDMEQEGYGEFLELFQKS